MDPLLDFDHLSKIPLFEGLSSADLNDIVRSAYLRQAAVDEFFFMQGEEADTLFILREGRVKLTQVTTDGQQILLRIIGPWTIFAVVSLAKGRNYPVSAQVTEAGSAYTWSRKRLVEFTLRYPRLAVNAIQLMSGYVQEFQDRLRELATERVERRLARTLLRLVNQSGKKIPGGVLINMHLTRQDLAEMIGTTLYTVSRILSQWETDGLILSGRERIVIQKPHGLVRIAEDL